MYFVYFINLLFFNVFIITPTKRKMPVCITHIDIIS